MTTRPDFTRWNRSGLTRFRYVDGNAATFLDDLRARLAAAFPEWMDIQLDEPADEPPDRRLARLVAQEQGPRRDWAWEIARSFARALHIQTEYLDAYANEGFLETATQWEHVRLLRSMTGVVPAPPASAEAALTLVASTGDGGVVEAGLQVQHTPPDGGLPVVFETLDAIAVHPALNQLRLAGRDRNPGTFEPLARIATSQWPVPDGVDVAAGQGAVLAWRDGDRTRHHAVRVAAVDAAAGRLAIAELNEPHGEPIPNAIPIADAVLDCAPTDRRSALLNGADVIAFVDAPSVLGTNIAVAWRRKTADAEVGSEDLATGVLTTIAGKRARLLAKELPQPGATIWQLEPSLRNDQARFRFPSFAQAFWQPRSDASLEPLPADMFADEATRTERFQVVVGNDELTTLYVLPRDGRRVVGVVRAIGLSGDVFEGSSRGVKTGEWAILTYLGVDGRELQTSALVRSVEAADEGTRIDLDAGGVTQTLALDLRFKGRVRARDHDTNPTILEAGAGGLDLEIEPGLDPMARGLLRPGRMLVLAQEGASQATVLATLVAAVGSILKVDVHATRPVPLTVAGARLSGNVVRAGHGELQREQILGNGDAAIPGQSFVADLTDLSFRRDPDYPSALRADVQVRVDDQVYTQRPSLAQSGPADPHFALRLLSDGQAQLTFGDGRRGRRLPTGISNVRLQHRTGHGVDGNLPAGADLTLLAASPHVSAAALPLAATGGAPRATAADLRDVVATPLVTLDRAVCLSDVAQLARSHPGIAQAEAFASRTGRERGVVIDVKIVASSRGAEAGLVPPVDAFLNARVAAGVRVRTQAFDAPNSAPRHRPLVRAELALTPDASDAVHAELRERLLHAFSPQRRRFGQPLFRSEIVDLIAAHPGVAHLRAALVDRATNSLTPVEAVFPDQRDIVHLVDPEDVQLERWELAR